MRSNVNDDLAPNTITKKFWSSFRSALKSSRIPEKMFLDGVIRNDPENIANLFNQYFFAQFSEESSYEIDIEFNHDPFFDFTFNETFIYNLLKQTNPNKSQGPDNIGGYLLKKLRSLYIFPSCNHF